MRQEVASSHGPTPAPGVGRFHLGCAVWAYPGWVGRFYPPATAQRDMLRLYGERLTAVEGNTTFYAVPAPDTVRRWAQQMPPGFRFVPKLPQMVTHQGALAPRLDGALQFVDDMRPLGERLGPMFAQLPSSYGPGRLADLEAFVRVWPEDAPPLLVEVRHTGWFRDEHAGRLDALLSGHGVGRVVLDSRPVHEGGGSDAQAGSQRRKPRVPLAPVATARTCMVRYIGHPDGERNPTWLEGWAERVDAWLRTGHDVLFFCHCPREEHSPALARTFQELLVARGAPVPALPWDASGDLPQQLTMF